MASQRSVLFLVSLIWAFATPSLANEGMAQRYGCLECHAADSRVPAPRFSDIAAKYRDDDGARDRLVQSIKHGSKFNWTSMTRGVPMPPYASRLTDEQIKQLVDWLLTF